MVDIFEEEIATAKISGCSTTSQVHPQAGQTQCLSQYTLRLSVKSIGCHGNEIM